MTRMSVINISTGGVVSSNMIDWTGKIGDCCDVEKCKELNVDDVKICKEFKKVIYKQCGFKISTTGNMSKDFAVLHLFNKKSFPASHRASSGLDNDTFVILFGKNNGKAGTENKYEFPPPIDNVLYYGGLCLVKININRETGEFSVDNITLKDWGKTYEALFGGFDDCDDDDDDDDDIYTELPTTKNGYAKDGFVVDDEEDLSEYETDEEFCLSDEY